MLELFLASALALVAPVRVTTLPGFTLVGEDWTYDLGDGGAIVHGKLIEPTSGSAPHPAVLISHGQGGSAATFGAQKAAVLRTWGFVCIAPDYTHVDLGYAPGTDGWSAENERRARACLAILASRSDVDATRIAAYGNSKGAFVTAGLCGSVASGVLRAAAITAGGTSGTNDASLAAPAVQEVQGITTPFLMLHGGADGTVPPVQSETLDAILAANDVPHARWLWRDVGHDLHASHASEVYTMLRAWFSEQGVLGEPSNTPPTIDPIDETSIPLGGTTPPIPFVVRDGESGGNWLTTSAFSLDVGVVPNAGLVLGGGGNDRTIRATGVAGVAGAATIVVAVDDGELSRVTAFEVVAVGGAITSFCSGDGLDADVTSACPCANFGDSGRGCAHSANPQGALLATSGTSNPDTLVLAASDMPSTAGCVFLQGDERADSVFGDGVRCTGGTLIRLRVRTSSGGAAQFPAVGDPSVSTRGFVTPGSGVVRYYQTYFRNSAASFCPPATFNATNGSIVAW